MATSGDGRARPSSSWRVTPAERLEGAVLDARVDDHPDPVPELRRIVDLYEAYALLDEEGDAVAAGLSEAERYEAARRRAPDAMELVFWMGIEHAKRGELDDARASWRSLRRGRSRGGRPSSTWPTPAARDDARARRAVCCPQAPAGAIGLGSAYQLVAVVATCSPMDSSQRSASIAALQPSPAAVTAWRYRWSWTSPATNTPSMLVLVSPGPRPDTSQ